MPDVLNSGFGSRCQARPPACTRRWPRRTGPGKPAGPRRADRAGGAASILRPGRMRREVVSASTRGRRPIQWGVLSRLRVPSARTCMRPRWRSGSSSSSRSPPRRPCSGRAGPPHAQGV
ncbi:hypothetical protein SAM_2179, partial [Streptococcus agalactiae CJB111]